MKRRAKVVLAAVALLRIATAETQAQWSPSVYDGFSEQAPWTDKHLRDDKPSSQNGNAGYAGSELPDTEYHPDRQVQEYYRERTAPLPPLDNGMYSSRPNPYCTNAPLCGRRSDR